MFLNSVVLAVAVDEVIRATLGLLRPGGFAGSRFGKRTISGVSLGSLAAALGAVVAGDSPQLLEELVIDLEVVVGVRLGVVLLVAVVVVSPPPVVAHVAVGGVPLAAGAEGHGLARRRRRRRRGGQGSGLRGRHPQGLVLLLLYGFLDLRAHVCDVHAGWDLGCGGIVTWLMDILINWVHDVVKY